jgi:hypothetical protein
MSPKYTEDDLVEHLRKLPFEKLKTKLYENDRYPFITNPMTFETKVSKLYHNIITGSGWTVEEFEFELNYGYDNK